MHHHAVGCHVHCSELYFDHPITLGSHEMRSTNQVGVLYPYTRWPTGAVFR